MLLSVTYFALSAEAFGGKSMEVPYTFWYAFSITFGYWHCTVKFRGLKEVLKICQIIPLSILI